MSTVEKKPETEAPRFTLMQTGATAPAEPAPAVPEGKVRVISGAHEQEFPNLAGRSVAGVRASLKDVFNISKDAQVRINGQPGNEDHMLRPNDTVEFVRPVGQKG